MGEINYHHHVAKRPRHVQFHPTNRCNLNCLFCWVYNLAALPKEMPDARWLEITEEVCILKAKQVTISGGGEPLLRPSLVLRMMEQFDATGIPGVLITNGTLISDKLAQRIARLEKWDIQFSIHGSTAEIDNHLRNHSQAFQQSMKGIDHINRARKASGKNDSQLAMRMVVTKENFTDLPSIVRLAGEKGMSRVYLRTVNEGESNFKGKLSVPKEGRAECYESLSLARQVAKESGTQLEIEFDTEQLSGATTGKVHTQEVQRGPGRQFCPIPFTELVIFANGTVSTCCNFFEQQFKPADEITGWLEDVNKRSLKEIWYEGFPYLRANMFAKKGLNKVCRTCSSDMRFRITNGNDKSI